MEVLEHARKLWAVLLCLIGLACLRCSVCADIWTSGDAMEGYFSSPLGNHFTLCQGQSAPLNAHVTRDIDTVQCCYEDVGCIDPTDVDSAYMSGWAYSTTWSGGHVIGGTSAYFIADAPGDFAVVAHLHDNWDAWGGDPASVDADITHTWHIHVLPAGPPPSYGPPPPGGIAVSRFCDGLYIQIWPNSSPGSSNGGSSNGGGSGCGCGGTTSGLQTAQSTPQPRVVNTASTAGVPLVTEPTMPGPPDIPSDLSCGPYFPTYLPCIVLGPFADNTTSDITVEGIKFAIALSSGSGSVTAELSDGGTRTWSGQMGIWDGCQYQLPMIGFTDSSGNETTITRTDDTDPSGGGNLCELHTPLGSKWGVQRKDTRFVKCTTEIVRPDGTAVDRTLDSNGKTAEIFIPSGTDHLSSTTYSYDTNGRLASVTSGTKTTVYEYPDASTVEVKDIPSSKWPSYSAGDVSSETDYVYGGPDADGIATTTVTRKALSPSSQDQTTVVAYHYAGDMEGQIDHVTDPYSKTTSYSYEVKPELPAVPGRNSAHNFVRLTEVKDPENNTTKYHYKLYGDSDNTVPKLWIPPVESVEHCDSNSNVLSTESYTYYDDDTVTPANPRWLRTSCDVRGKYTYYKRDLTKVGTVYTKHPERVLAVEVSDSPHTPDEWYDATDSSITTIKCYDYYDSSCDDGMAGQLKRETVPGIGPGGADQVTEYKYGYGQSGKWRTSPTETIYHDSSDQPQSSKTEYDDMQRVLKTTDANNRSIWYAYDVQGRPTLTIYKFVDANENTKPDYDLNPTTGAITNSELIAYSQNFYSCCNLLWDQDENLHKTYYGYDDMKRVNATWTDIPGQSESAPLVTYDYDNFGNQQTVTTYSGASRSTDRVTTYTYDKLNRVTKIHYPGASTPSTDGIIASEEFGYDDLDRLQWKKGGADSEYTLYKYDDFGRLSNVYYDVATLPSPFAYPDRAANVTYGYDGASGMKTSMVERDDSGTVLRQSSYTYDGQGRLETFTPPTGLGANQYLRYYYNNAGQKTEIKITDGVNTPPYDVTYDYYANGWLKDVNYNSSTVANYTYDAVGNRLTQANGNGTSTEYVYDSSEPLDPRYFLNSITHKHGTAALGTIDYTGPPRDNAGNPKSMTDWIGKWEYRYDENNRLTSAVPPNPVPEQPAGGPYEYDWAGNRVRPPRDPNPPSATNQMVYNAADQLTTWPGMHTYTYYGDGSLKEEKNAAGSQVMKSYTYTSDGLLATATFDGKTLTNTWDADKNRVGFSVGSTNHTFVYDIAAEIPAVVREDGVYYIRDGSDSLIARTDSIDGIRYYHFDELGSTRLLTNADGSVTDSYAYDACGAVLSHERRVGSVDQPYQYVGQSGYYTHWHESGMGIIDIGVRFLDTEASRFTQRDAIPAINSYEYVGDNPATWVDVGGYYTHKPGGPYHPPGAVACKQTDSYDEIVRKMGEIRKVIDSHKGFAGHEQDLSDWENAISKCQKLLDKKRRRAIVPVPVPVPDPLPEKIKKFALATGVMCYLRFRSLQDDWGKYWREHPIILPQVPPRPPAYGGPPMPVPMPIYGVP